MARDTKKYGILFLGGNRTCTTGEPNEFTGKRSIACEIHGFDTAAERDAWVDAYRSDNKEKIAVTKKEIRKYKRGHTWEELARELEELAMELEQ